MRLRVGTSGFAYPAWKGNFYPAGIRNEEMLAHYAARLDTVEINNTFHRFPRAHVVESWVSRVPEGFVFVLKAPRRISHKKGFEDVDEPMRRLVDGMRPLGAKAGPTLFQFPPWFRRDLDVLARLIERVPDGLRAAFEFRHSSWLEGDVYERLRERAIAVVVSDGGKIEAPLAATGPFGYLRLRRAAYDDDELRRWSGRIDASGWDEAFVFFKHEEEGAAPAMAARLRELSA